MLKKYIYGKSNNCNQTNKTSEIELIKTSEIELIKTSEKSN